jgi:proline iminopeptidase
MMIPVDGAELSCVTVGAGPPCLLLSGIGSRPYQRQTAELTRHFTMVHVDPRGSGLSTGEPAALTFDRLAEDLDAVRAALGLDRVAVLGHSILGMLALEYGRRRPAAVSHLILAGTPPLGDMRQVLAAGAAFFEEDASDERKRILRENLAALPAGASPGQAMFAQTPARFFDPRFDAAPLFAEAVSRPAFLMHVLGTLAPSWDVLADPRPLPPAFIALGRHDYVVPPRMWEGVAGRLPGATVHVFPRSGHQPFFEEPEAFAQAVTAWMATT